jgi:multidrug efflux pump subunit AcrA (membrane-fusion protein)
MHASAAPVFSLADEQRTRAEAAAWARFVAAGDREAFCAGWLALLAARIERARGALLLVASQSEGGDASFGVAAVWPDPQRDMQYLGPVAQRALAERAAVVAAPGGGAPGPDGAAHVAYPVEVGGRLVAVVVIDVGAGVRGTLQSALRQVHWASAWLLDHFGSALRAEREAELARVALLSELLASALQHRRLLASALAVANELALRLRCDRVAVGLEERAQVMPLALSHTATFDRRSDVVRTLGEAMDEVLDLGVAVAVPAAQADAPGALAHAEAARALNVQALLSVPLVHEAQTIGVLSFERQAGPAFDADEQRIARSVGVMLGPIWALQRAQERSLWQRARDAWRAALQRTVGPQHPGLKLVAAVLALVVLGSTLIDAPHRVAARTVVEGSMQIASAAPFEGFIATALARAGDTVKTGQPLAALDDRDLRLERARWHAEMEQQQRKFQVAMAQADRGAMGVIAAQIAQSEAQLALAAEKLARATLVAPFDAVVVSGDLSQSIGMPVEQGKLLFQLAPLEGYRVVMQVDDHDIARLALAQRGELVLSSLPDRALAFTVSAITPVATQVDGRNVFRVEAQVDGAPAGLRPGMEGVAKVVVGERSWLWIWTHSFVDWMRLALWNWMP